MRTPLYFPRPRVGRKGGPAKTFNGAPRARLCMAGGSDELKFRRLPRRASTDRFEQKATFGTCWRGPAVAARGAPQRALLALTRCGASSSMQSNSLRRGCQPGRGWPAGARIAAAAGRRGGSLGIRAKGARCAGHTACQPAERPSQRGCLPGAQPWPVLTVVARHGLVQHVRRSLAVCQLAVTQAAAQQTPEVGVAMQAGPGRGAQSAAGAVRWLQQRAAEVYQEVEAQLALRSSCTQQLPARVVRCSGVGWEGCAPKRHGWGSTSRALHSGDAWQGGRELEMQDCFLANSCN